ncbi:HBR393Wp [Eremothecium sinecaudum]|uniref:HBR393Wp n=1 Tax=Eremothecium sinecaudum TaxID=45286 RepID=A0A120K1D9_9SACH|nr:HBR393Wp [Eremothecium sinecaudum]AMD19294.1 HBR393Wp [Eremothecium sinecaudum]
MTVGLGRHLSRSKPHRTALLKNLTTQLLQHGAIVSTIPKLKETQKLAERVITIAKKARSNPKMHIPELQSRLFLAGDNAHLIKRLIHEIAGRYQGRNNGFTRLLRLEPRLGDRAPSAMLELLDVPVTNAEGGLNRGNMKLWLNVKAAVYAVSKGEPFTDLTLLNLNKMANGKDINDFMRDVATIREHLLKHQNITTTEEETQQFIEELKAAMAKPRVKDDTDKGYKIVSERPPLP